MRYLRMWILATVMAGALATAAPEATEVPQFTLRCRVTGVGGEPVAADRKTTFYLSGIQGGVTTVGDAWSDDLAVDIDAIIATQKLYPNLYLKSYPIVFKLRVRPVDAPTQVEAELRWVTPPAPGAEAAPDPAAVLDPQAARPPADLLLRGELFGELLGFLVWREEDRAPHAATMAEYEKRYWQALEGVALTEAQRPKQFPIVDRYIGGDNDIAAWEAGITNLSRAGFTALMLPPGERYREILLSTGLRHTASAVYNPPGYAFDHDPEITPAAIREWAEKIAKPFLDSGYDRRDMAFYAMSDEPGWYFPAQLRSVREKPAILARFRDYLKSQGLTPADVGAESWDRVQPIGRSEATTLPRQRLFYWSMRFYPWDSSRHFAESTRALEAAFYPGLPIVTNWNFFSGRFYFPGNFAHNPDKQSPDAAMGSHDWFEFGRLRGGTMLWTEDWFGDDRAWQWSFYASKLNSAARLGNITFGGYVIPRTAGQREDGILQKILTIVGHGGKGLKYFVFGPEYNFPGNCYSFKSHLLAKMAEAHGMIGAAEDLLWPAKRPPARVAIFHPRSALVWDGFDGEVAPTALVDATNARPETRTVDYLAEVYGLYLALQHANIPVDWVDEAGLTSDGLADISVLYVTAPDIPIERLEALAAWVRQGGTLVTVSNAATRDRYHQPDATLSRATGIAEQSRPRLFVPDVRKLPVAAAGDGRAGAFAALGVRGELIAGEHEVLGSFADGVPAVVQRQVGKGRAVHYAWLPGCSYIPSATATRDHLPVDYSTTLRDWIVLPVQLAGITAPVTVDAPMIETPLLLGDGGAVVTLLNWRGAAMEQVAMTVRLPFAPTRVEAVKAGPLAVASDKAGIYQVTLPLGAADIVKFYR